MNLGRGSEDCGSGGGSRGFGAIPDASALALESVENSAAKRNRRWVLTVGMATRALRLSEQKARGKCGKLETPEV